MLTLCYLHGVPDITAEYKNQIADFKVEEDLGFEPDGEGEHVVVLAEKRGLNTQFVADKLAEFAGIAAKQVSYSGLKDRHAVTSQWFGLHMPGQMTPDFSQFMLPQCQIQRVSRQRKKLRIGVHKGNYFTLLLRNVSDRHACEQRLQRIVTQGFLNYFGEQRFGLDNQNYCQAKRWALGEIRVKDKRKRAFYLSAARSFLFNEIVSLRVKEQCHNRVLVGDVVQLQGSGSWFVAKAEECADLQTRLVADDIALTAPLIGHGELDSADQGHALEMRVLQTHALLWSLIQEQGMQMARRSILIKPKACQWQWQTQNVVKLKFWLPSGSYATSLLRELIG